MFHITDAIKVKGSNRVSYNISKDGNPFGQIWTFKSRGEKHPFHIKFIFNGIEHYHTFETLSETTAYLFKEGN